MSLHSSEANPDARESQPAATMLDQHLRNASTVFYAAGIAIVLGAANFSQLPVLHERAALNSIACLGLLSALFQVYFPWQRFHRNLLLANTLAVIGLVALLVAYSGGVQSPFVSYYFMITVFASLYYDRVPAIAVGVVVAIASLLPLVGAHEAAAATQLLLGAPIHLSIAVAGQMMAQELARQRAQRAALATQLEQASESHALAVEAARTDPLTQLRNRAALVADMAQMIGQNGSAVRPFSLLFLDIDHFKEINDRHGHGCGDDILRQIATLLRTHLRQSDIATRYGGDEFVVILPGAPPEIAVHLAERLRSTVEQHRFWSPESTTRLAVTVSVGAAAFPEDGATMDDLILHADASMYTAKRAGRNQTRWLQDRTPIRMDPEQA